MAETETYYNPNTRRNESRETKTGAEADAAKTELGRRTNPTAGLAAAAAKAKREREEREREEKEGGKRKQSPQKKALSDMISGR